MCSFNPASRFAEKEAIKANNGKATKKEINVGISKRGLKKAKMVDLDKVLEIPQSSGTRVPKAVCKTQYTILFSRTRFDPCA